MANSAFGQAKPKIQRGEDRGELGRLHDAERVAQDQSFPHVNNGVMEPAET
jgi:hypothetical protein